jgi:hypothetical protein
MTPTRSEAGTILEVRDVTYTFADAPDHVKHAVSLLVQKWGQNMDQAPDAELHEANLLAQRWGTITSPIN